MNVSVQIKSPKIKRRRMYLEGPEDVPRGVCPLRPLAGFTAEITDYF